MDEFLAKLLEGSRISRIELMIMDVFSLALRLYNFSCWLSCLSKL